METKELRQNINELIRQYYESLKKECNTYGELKAAIKQELKHFAFCDVSRVDFVSYVEKEFCRLLEADLCKAPVLNPEEANTQEVL